MSIGKVWKLNIKERQRRLETSLVCVSVSLYFYVFLYVLWSLKLFKKNLKGNIKYIGSKCGNSPPQGSLLVSTKGPHIWQRKLPMTAIFLQLSETRGLGQE